MLWGALVILAGVMLKLGTYGLLRFGVFLFPEAARWSRPLFLTLAVIGIVYVVAAAAALAACLCSWQQHWRRPRRSPATSTGAAVR